MFFLWNNAMTGTRRLTLPSLRVSVLQRLGVCRRWATVAALPLWAAFWLCAAQAQVPARTVSRTICRRHRFRMERRSARAIAGNEHVTTDSGTGASC